MSKQSDLFGQTRDLFSQNDPDMQDKVDDTPSAVEMEPVRDPLDSVKWNEDLYPFDHPYPRFGLAYVFYHHGIGDDFEAVLEDEQYLARLAAETIDECLDYVRIHTQDNPDGEGERQLRFDYVSRDDLETSGQTSSKLYFLAPHVATDDTGTNGLIKAARSFRDQLAKGEKLHKSTSLRRSFSPFTTKINEGTASLSDPKTTFLQAAFTLIATLAPRKPAVQIDFTNQVVVPDLDLARLIRFIDLFGQIQSREMDGALTTVVQGKSKRRRPPLYEGNYPGAPRSAVFGPVGLVAAMGRWVRRAEAMQKNDVTWAAETLEALPKRPLYLVSYDSSLTRQAQLGHHVTRLALEHDLPKALGGLYRARLYNADENRRGSPKRQIFDQMASRFLQFYTRAAFRDFLAFRAQYGASFSLILKDYFMSQASLSEALVRSARAYGAYLNFVAYVIAKDEVDNKETGRSIYEAKSRALAQMESTAMSSKTASSLFGRLNRDAGQRANRDAPEEAGAFMEAAIAGAKIDLDTAKNLILAFMRLRTSGDKGDESANGQDASGAATEDDPMMEKG